jgi:hypothetical protein
MALRGRYHIRSKIVINNEIIEQLNTFNYLGCTLSYEKEKNVANKLPEFCKSQESLIKS